MEANSSTLDPIVLRKMMDHAFTNLKEKRSYLDDINVFPVPDGDTGVNMQITVQKIIEQLETTNQDDLSEITENIIQGAFSGAKGNSGIILSQFLIGFFEMIRNLGKFCIESFVSGLEEGSKKAYKAVMNPREGTMISVMRETAEHAKTILHLPWKDFVSSVFNCAHDATQKTPKLLKELKGVVDSGALGFLYVLQGWFSAILNYLHHSSILSVDSEIENLHLSIDAEKSASEILYRFCTEGVISFGKYEINEIREALVDLGDSLLLVESLSPDGKKYAKLHIHTNKPDVAIKQFAHFGTIESFKIDDMKQQTLDSH